MKKKRVFTAEEKMQILREAEEFGTTETCRKYDLANSLFYRWKSQFNAKGIEGLTNLEPKILVCDPELGAPMDEVKRKWAWEDLPDDADPDDFLLAKRFDTPEMKRINFLLSNFAKEYTIRAPRIIAYLQSIDHPLGNSNTDL